MNETMNVMKVYFFSLYLNILIKQLKLAFNFVLAFAVKLSVKC